MTIFGAADKPAKMFLPVADIDWNIGDIARRGDANLIPYSLDQNYAEITDIRKCFAEANHIFALGRDIERSVMNVDLLMFLGRTCDDSGNAKSLIDLRNAYAKSRISKLKAPIQICFDAFTTNGFLVNMCIRGVDPSTQSCHVVFTFIVDEKEN